MSLKISIITLLAIISLGLYSQRPTLELTFTAVDDAAHVHLESIKIMNRTQGGDTILYWPDTVLSIDYLGMPEVADEQNAFKVLRSYPNPVREWMTVSLFVPDQDLVSIMVTDILGRVVLESARILEKGEHSFRFTPGGGHLYFFTAIWQGHNSSLKILHMGNYQKRECSLEYSGNEGSSEQLKVENDNRGFSFDPGDELLYIGYTSELESGILDSPEESATCIFQFATNIPCPDMPTVEYEGQVYNTIQIFSQCWLKESLNVGVMINGTIEQSNNGTIEKYCYNNEPDSCAKYGGLYQWWEMMQYTTQQGSQGICPPGWHLPTDEEWKVLEGAVDSQYGIGNNTWDNLGHRGNDAGMNLKTTSSWNNWGSGNDLFGFSGLPGGIRYHNGGFYDVGDYGYWWSSTEYNVDIAWYRFLGYYYPEVGRDDLNEDFGFSVRCLRDY